MSTPSSFTAHACTWMDNLPLTARHVTFQGSSVNLQARILTESGYFSFELVVGEGTQLGTLVCENTWRQRVDFVIEPLGQPAFVVQADPRQRVRVPIP
jgi:urease accessory protein UreH